MQDPNIIATLVATRDLAKRAFQLDYSEKRYQAPTCDIRPFTRENTPYGDPKDEDREDGNPKAENPKDEDDTAHRLKLSFDKPPKTENLRAGDRELVEKVSRKHFSITFDAQRRVVLRDSSKYGTTVSYNGEAGGELRSHFPWIIFPGFETIGVSIPRADLSFKIKLGTHEDREEEFSANVDKLFPPSVRMGEDGLATPMQQLGVHSQDTSVTASESATPRDGPIYRRHERIGKGAFGKVYRLTDVSTGEPYAGKSCEYSDCEREVAIMSEVKHEHIVSFVN